MDENITVTLEAEEHRTLFEVFIDFWAEIFSFFKYIFYDIYLGE